MPGKRALSGGGRAYVGFWFHCSPNPLVSTALLSGRSFTLSDPRTLLDALDAFLVRPAERKAVLGDGTGSEAFRRVCGSPRPD